MKKTLKILLVLLLLLSLLPAGAWAAGETAIPSDRPLRVDGKPVRCESYEIGGEIWFKLRDIALALSGTGSRFSVAWDAETRTILLTTGEAYVPTGVEGVLRAEESAAAVPGAQALRINGEAVLLPAWNIGGCNYFRLADLAPVLGFQADWDEASDTAIIRARATCEPKAWLTEEFFISDSSGRENHEVYTYDEEGRTLSHLSEGVTVLPGLEEPVSFQSVTYFYYDELGRQTELLLDHMNGEGPRTASTFEYDVWGQLVYNGGGEESPESGTTYTYDERGNLLSVDILRVTLYGVDMDQRWEMRTTFLYEYDEYGRVTDQRMISDGVTVSRYTYAYDEEGRIVRTESFDPAGNLLSVTEDEYENGRRVKSVEDYGTYSIVRTYTYAEDETSRTITTVTESPFGNSVFISVSDKQGNFLYQEQSGDAGSSVTVWTYDEAGRLLRQETSGDTGTTSVTSYTYDGEGNVLSCVREEGGVREETLYEYDYAAKKMTWRRTTTYPEGPG